MNDIVICKLSTFTKFTLNGYADNSKADVSFYRCTVIVKMIKSTRIKSTSV